MSNLPTPSLVLISISGNGLVFHTVGLPAGALAEGNLEDDGGAVPWKTALSAIERSVEEKAELLLDGVRGLERMDHSGGTLADAVERVKLQVEGD